MQRICVYCFIGLALLDFQSVTGGEVETFLEPYKKVAVPAAEMGILAELSVREGDIVSEKQVLAKLEDQVLQASLLVARAAKEALGDRRAAETDLKIREKQLQSYRQLHRDGNATEREMQQAENQYLQSVARLQSIDETLEVRRLEYERVKAQLKQRLLIAPVSGVVVRIEKEEGEFVSPTDPVVMQIVHLKSLKAVFSVPADESLGLRAGQRVNLGIGYEQKHCAGVIEFVSPVADAETHTVEVKIKIPNQSGSIRSGVICRWDLKVKDPPARHASRPIRKPLFQ